MKRSSVLFEGVMQKDLDEMRGIKTKDMNVVASSSGGVRANVRDWKRLDRLKGYGHGGVGYSGGKRKAIGDQLDQLVVVKKRGVTIAEGEASVSIQQGVISAEAGV